MGGAADGRRALDAQRDADRGLPRPRGRRRRRRGRRGASGGGRRALVSRRGLGEPAPSSDHPWMPELPTGTVTLLFTDIEGSTEPLQELGHRYAGAARGASRASCATLSSPTRRRRGRHARRLVLRRVPRAADAVAAARGAQSDARRRAQSAFAWASTPASLIMTEEGYVGIDVHRAARIAPRQTGADRLSGDARARSTRGCCAISASTA